MSSLNVAVIGAGIIGASIANSLSENSRCRVLVLEAAKKPAEGATSKSWAWLNANHKTPAHYKELNKAGMAEWKRLNKESPEAYSEFPGTIYLGDKRNSDEAYPLQKLDSSEVANLEPEISTVALHSGGNLYEQEGYAYPAAAATYFLQQAESRGAEVHFASTVESFVKDGENVTEIVTRDAHFKVDVVVLAAGLGVPGLASKLGAAVPLVDKPRTLTIITQPLPKILKHIIVTEEAFIMQRRDGEVLISFFKAEGSGGAAEEEVPANNPLVEESGRQLQETVEASAVELNQGHPNAAAHLLNASDAIAQKGIARAAKICPSLKDASLGSFSLAKFPYPADAHPIVGWLPGSGNVYVAVTHSGVTLGPLLGRLVAGELAGRPAEVLQRYRPDRDFGDTSHWY